MSREPDDRTEVEAAIEAGSGREAEAGAAANTGADDAEATVQLRSPARRGSDLSSPSGLSSRDTGAADSDVATAATVAAGADADAAAPTLTAARAPSLDASTTTMASPIEALRHDELVRTRRFVVVIFGMALAVGGALPFLGGDPTAKKLVVAALAISTAMGGWIGYLSLRPERYRQGPLAVAWTLCTGGVLAGMYYFGPFSAAVTLLVLGIYFVALGQSRIIAGVVYGMCAVYQGVLAALLIAGVIPDRGLFTARGVSPRDQVLTQVLVQAILLSAFLLARSSRRATVASVAALEQAVRAVAQQEGMLQEAREDLDRMLRLGDPGRFSDRVLGSFRLGVVIGRGAMGDVYEATHVQSGELAAVKLLQPGRLERPEYLVRFLREIEISASLKVANVVRVLEIGDASAPVPYLAMERLFGRDLSDHLRRRKRMPPPEVVDLITQVCAGMDAAAAAGIVHRDLKPQNLFLHEPPGGRPLWKILDFGVSKLADGSGTLTHGRLVGTPGYMAPEQAQGRSVDFRADIYAVGAIAYRAITGLRPFGGADVAGTVYRVVYTMPPQPSSLVDVPDAVDAVLAVALAKAPEERFDSGAELAEALADAARGIVKPRVRARADALLRARPWGSER